MSRRIGLVVALTALITAVVVAAAPAAPRSVTVTRGLDYLHARQDATGGFGDPSATSWAILGAVATGERMGTSAWTVGGKNPVAYLQGRNPVSDAAASSNAPTYYAQLIMAYVAAGREDLAYNAGTNGTDLLAKLYSYQDVEDGSPTQWSFSLSESNRELEAVRTTAWAVLALEALSIRPDSTRFAGAVAWLLGQGDADGGFPIQPGWDSDADSTALAVQALIAGKTDANAAAVNNAIEAAVTAPGSYLQGAQNADGGFPNPDGRRTDGQSTALAVMAIDAAGQDPSGSAWEISGDTPWEALKGLQVPTGAFARNRGVLIRPVQVTGHALVALSRLNLTRYPATRPAARTPFRFNPQFVTVSPKDGAKFTSTRIVLIRATYRDGSGGTGIRASAVRLYIDGADRTRPAVVGTSGLHLQLKNVANGTHTFKIVLVDRAGNSKSLQRSFTVAVASPTPAPSPTSTWRPPNVIVPPTTTPTRRPTPSTTLYPSGYPSPSPSPSPSTSGAPIAGTTIASPSPSGTATGGTGGGGSAAGFVGGTLLAMLPIGAGLAYLALRRREDALAAAEEGRVLSGGGSAWDRLKRTLSKSKDIIKPAGS